LKITRASHIELLARAVVLVAGMDLPDADRAAVLARVRVAAGKEAPSPGLDQAETLNLISRLTE